MFQVQILMGRKKKKKKKVGINAVCWTAAKNCSRRLAIRTMRNLRRVHSRSREQLWSKTLCLFTVTWSCLWQRGEGSPKQEPGHAEKCLEWGMDKALPAVLTLAVCIYDNWKLINLSEERMWKTNWKSLALRFVLSCQGHFGLLESNVRQGGLISEIFLL